MAELIESQQELFEASDITDETQQVTEQPQPEPVVQETPSEEDVPTKYRGKTAAEIARMHMEAEKLIGRQAQEVGEVRRLADELIKRQLETKAEVPATKEDEIDFFEDPKKYVTKAVDSHPAVLEAKEQAFEIKKMQTLNRLKNDFPDFESVVTDPSFAEWVNASPIRLQLYAQANAQMDYDAASELLSNFRYVKPRQQAQATSTAVPSAEVKAAQKQAVKQATVDVGSTSAATTSSKVYRRADLIRLQLEDPDRYYALQDEIMSAYAEGRVK